MPIVLADQDAPVLDNGLIRVRYDASAGNKPGFRVDAWNGSAYVEQGKITVARVGDVTGVCDTWVSAGLHASPTTPCTPERATILVVLANSADAYSRERVFITLQRGWLGAKFEVYPAVKADGETHADATLRWQPAPNAGAADVVDSEFKSDTQTLPTPQGTGVIGVSPVGGTGAGLNVAPLGASSFAGSENFQTLLRELTVVGTVSPFQTQLAVLQAANAVGSAYHRSTAYGTTVATMEVQSQNGAGWVAAHLSFTPTVSDQVLQASTFRNSSGTTSQFADANAYNGQCVKDTQAALTNATCQKVANWISGKYRVFTRARVDSGATGSFALGTGTSTTYTVTTTSTSYGWLDLGDVTCAASPTLSYDSWRSAGASGAVYTDRLVAFLIEDRTRSTAIFSGCRDRGQAALMDSQTLGALVSR
jgi:hypothetical protein